MFRNNILEHLVVLQIARNTSNIENIILKWYLYFERKELKQISKQITNKKKTIKTGYIRLMPA